LGMLAIEQSRWYNTLSAYGNRPTYLLSCRVWWGGVLR
jgi:hypothetical protein